MKDIDRQTLIAAGRRHDEVTLQAQARCTCGILAEDLAAMVQEELLPADILERVAQVDAELREESTRRSRSTFGAHDLTRDQESATQELKLATRRLDRCAANAFEGTPTLKEYRKHTVKNVGLARLCNSVRRKLAFLEGHADAAAEFGVTAALRAKVAAKVAALEKADANQEAARSQLGERQRRYLELKGRLYFLLRQINTAGQALYAGDLAAAAKYNFRILYRGERRRARGAKDEETAEGAEPAAAAESAAAAEEKSG